jgi:DNA replication regulator DPB11
MSAKTSVIICNDSGCNEQKIKFAGSRRIPAVQPTWLWECIRSGKLQPFGGYLVSVPAPQPQISKPKRKLPSATDVATARLSTEESFEMQQRKAQVVKKVAKQRGTARPRTLDLALSADPTPVSTTDFQTYANAETIHSPLTEDELSIPGLDGQASLPLQDITANSPRRPSTSSNGSKPISRQRSSSAESLIRPTRRKSKHTKEPTPDSVIPADTALFASVPQESEPQKEPPEEKDYSEILAQLRANRKAVPTPVEQDPTRRRARRQLGRAASTRSNDSSANGSGQQLNLDDDDDRVMAQEYQPSQELGWDSPGAAKARDQMIKRLGGRLSEKSVRVEGIGVVRDVASESLGRLGRRRRDKGF